MTTIPVSPTLVKLVGPVTALWLGALMQAPPSDHPIIRSDDSWGTLLGLSRPQVQRARNRARRHGFVTWEVHVRRGAPTVHLVVCREAITAAMEGRA